MIHARVIRLVVCALMLIILVPRAHGQEATLPGAEWNKLFTWRSIGPANMGGRITGIAVVESDPSTYYVATASGGLLKTINNGSTFEHQFDKEATVSLGTVAIAPGKRDLVWVGTGEANPRNSVSYGDGVYHSTDGGKSWKNMGLKSSYQISKIIVHPKNSNIVYVGALGRLYGPSEERGLYKTVDGGKTWQRVLFVDDRTGVIDMVMHPADPEILIAALWQRERDEFDSFLGPAKAPPGSDIYAPSRVHGPGSGIYKSTDGGATWKKLAAGLPKTHLGRIGLDWNKSNPDLVCAIVDSDKIGTGPPLAAVFLGVAAEAGPLGLTVTSIVPDSPGAKADLRKGDILVSIDGKILKKPEELSAQLQPKKPGDTVRLTFQRDGKNQDAEIKLALRPVGKGNPKEQLGSLGVQVEEALNGALITELVEKGAADAAGLMVGDVLTHFDGVKLDKPATLYRTLLSKKIGDKLRINYLRGTDAKETEATLTAPPAGQPGRPFSGRLGGQRENAQGQQGQDGDQTGGIYRSTDGGESWSRVNSLNERPFYFSVVRSDPTDEKTLYSLGINLYRSTDGGKTFSPQGINNGMHADHHDLWINPRNGRHMIAGTDGGVYVTYDRGANWEHLDHLALGQFYHVTVDNRHPYRVYGGLQDNGSWGGPSQTSRRSGPANADYQVIGSGDGFVCRVDSSNPSIVYAESQNGIMYRRNLETGESALIRPKAQPELGSLRFNWNTPFILSQHNPHLFYCAANYVFRSFKRGEDPKVISPEITRTKRGSATVLAESPKSPEILWVGTDDGAVWLTRDAGKLWTNLTDKLLAAGLPGPRWVASIEPSRAQPGRCYIVFDAHRSNDDEPYIFVTEDFGQTWKSLRGNLPTGSSRVLREDLVNPDLLYLGTEFALYASIDRGTSWFKLNGKLLPTVAIHEIAQPTTAAEIVAGTHGRSLWVLDVSTLRQLTTKHIQKATTLFQPSPVTRWRLDGSREGMFRTGTRHFAGQNPPRTAIIDFVLAAKAEKLSLKIVDIEGRVVRALDVAKEKEAGPHRISWDMTIAPSPTAIKGKNPPKLADNKPGLAAGSLVSPGVYRVVLEADGMEFEQTMSIHPDPNSKLATPVLDEYEEERYLRRQLRDLAPILDP